MPERTVTEIPYPPRQYEDHQSDQIPYWFLKGAFLIVIFVVGQIAVKWINRIWDSKERRRHTVGTGPNTFTMDEGTVKDIIAAFHSHTQVMQQIANTMAEFRSEQTSQHHLLSKHIEAENETISLLRAMQKQIVNGV